MKIFTKSALWLVASALVFFSCDKGSDDKPIGSNKYTLTVNITYPSGHTKTDVSSMKVSAVNSEKELTYEKEEQTGMETASFEVVAGQYVITVSGKLSATLSLMGSKNADVYADQTVEVTLSEVNNKSPLIFKEIYSTSYNYQLNDTYFEIVNNSDEVQYLDQVMIGGMTYLSGPNPWVDEAGNVLSRYPLYGVVAAFPGTGKDYPLQPGETVVIANDATNWEAVDLSSADWECYVPNAGQADVDYDVPNLDIPYNLENQRRLGPGFFGGAFVLAKLPEGMTPADFVADASNFMTEPNTEKTQLYCMMPSLYLLDAVEMYDAAESTHYHTLLPQDDAGYALVNGWSGKSIRRKVTQITSTGRVYYQDTNNSANDFLTGQSLTPGVHPSVVD